MILDVRSAGEFAAGHVPNARHLPFWSPLVGMPRLDILPGEAIVVYCGHGPRAWIAAAALRARGYGNVRLLRGHMRAWMAAGKPLE
ncbi:MAG: rhodanese-like domain-containing protein [Acidobacteriota bacterium]|nr:rhodanese-like domain-containing protein [Acidobacteriota bacterium]